MSSAIPARVHQSKRRTFLATVLSGLILGVFSPTSLQAVSGVASKTDAELAKAVIGTWEIPPSKKFLSFRKAFLTFNPNGTCKAIGITNDRASPRRVEVDAKWRVKEGYLVAEAIKTSPANRGVRAHLDLHDQIESIEDGTVKLRDEKGDKEEMRRINQLPSLPPLLTYAKPAAIYAPPPEYPLAARQRRWTGDGLFACNLRPDGTVASVVVLHSTGHEMLDQAAISALRRWKFKAEGSNLVQVPLKFTMSGGVRHRMSGAVISD
jgi:TonB family protein